MYLVVRSVKSNLFSLRSRLLVFHSLGPLKVKFSINIPVCCNRGSSCLGLRVDLLPLHYTMYCINVYQKVMPVKNLSKLMFTSELYRAVVFNLDQLMTAYVYGR